MAERKRAVAGVATAGVLLAGAGAGVAHLVEEGSHVRVPVVHPLPHEPVPLPHDPVSLPREPVPKPPAPRDDDPLTHVTDDAADALFDDPVVSEEIKQAIRLIREYRAGALTEEKVAAATCTVFTADASSTQDHDQFKAAIYDQLGADPNDFLTHAIYDRYIEMVVNTITVAHQGGPAAARWYVQYCVKTALTHP